VYSRILEVSGVIKWAWGIYENRMSDREICTESSMRVIDLAGGKWFRKIDGFRT